MIQDVFQSISSAARKLFTNWGALLITLLLYIALLAVVYLSINTREATLAQVVLGIGVWPLIALILFFVLQAMALSYVRVGVGAGYLLKRAFRDCWTLLLVSLPVILIAWLIVYLFNYADEKWVANVEHPQRAIELTINWGRIILLYFVLPLIAIHLWIAAMREGLGAAFRGLPGSVRRALSPRSVLIYIAVVVVCGAIAYALFFTKTHVKSDWGEWALVGARVAIALLALLFGWLIALGAMAEMTARRAMSEVRS